jgi:hypothetical protein
MRYVLLLGLLVATACHAPAAPTDAPAPTGPAPAIDAAMVAAAAPTPEPEPVATRCVKHEDWQEREACLGRIPPSPSHQAQAELGDPFGYICAYFGGVGGHPRCSDSGNVRVLSRWVDGAAPCPVSLSLYFAPMQPASGPGTELEEGAPGQPLKPMLFPSDGSVFGYLRLDHYILEAKTCEQRGDSVEATLTAWGATLQPQIFE